MLKWDDSSFTDLLNEPGGVPASSWATICPSVKWRG